MVTATKIVTILIFLVCLISSGCASAKVYILGIDADRAITDMRSKDTKGIILGIIASVGTHVAGHYIAASLVGADIEQQGVCEIVLNGNQLNSSNRRWFSRGGFVLQSIVNTLLTNSKATEHTSFTRGFTIGTMLEIGSYPLRYTNEGDLYTLDKYGGNAALEWGIYMGVSLYNFHIINQRGDND